MSNRQLYFLDTPGACPHCGILFVEDYELGVYAAQTLRLARYRGVCVPCLDVGRKPPSRSREIDAVSIQAMRTVWCGATGLGLPDGSNLRCNLDTWPTMEEFAACLEQQLEASAEDELFRRLVRARNDIAVAAEEFEDEENELKSAG